MAKSITFNDLLNKLTSVFKTDMYIYNFKYCIGGRLSEEDNEGRILCILNDEYSKVIKSEIDSEYIFFSDIKKAKKELDSYMKIVKDEPTKSSIRSAVSYIEDSTNKKGNWFPLIFTESIINELFIDRNIYQFFESNSDIATLGLAKSAFPLITEKNINDTEILYRYLGKDEESGLSTIVFTYSTDWFVIEEVITYFDI